jgi:hypothetical protein
MTPAIDSAKEVLAEAGYSTQVFVLESDSRVSRTALAFEDATVIGFVLQYDHSSDLISSWKRDSLRVAARQRVALTKAAQKAWNAYLILLTPGEADFGEALLMGQIEEDLEGMRKIARGRVTDAEHARQALLPLLPFKSKPTLDPIDMAFEIRTRTSELDQALVDTFLARANEGVVLQLLEDDR